MKIDVRMSRSADMLDVDTMKNHSTDEGPNISEELKAKFREALKGKLNVRTCLNCPQSRGFVQVMEFVIDMMCDATGRMDIASQRMEEFIALFKQMEENLMKARMLGDDGR